MAVYLVDYENVNTTLLAGDDVVERGDKVVVFYSKQASSISIDTLGKLQSKEIEVSFVKTTVGTSNALDFQLVSYLGYLVHTDEKRKFYIVSHDNGFQCVCDFWKNRNVQVELIGQIGSMGVSKDSDKYRTVLSSVITEKTQLEETISAIEHAATKTEINTWLTKHYDGKEVKKINKAIKALIKNLPGR